MHGARLLIIIIGIFAGSLSWAEEAEPKPGMVIVEPPTVTKLSAEGNYELTPYLERRGDWGFTASIGASSYSPINYEPDFLADDFKNVYKPFYMPMMELMFSVKRNLSFGSLGVEFGGGYYKNISDSDAVDSELQLIPVRIGAVYYMDHSENAHYVPYVAGGAYMMIYNESQANSSVNGNTQVAPYIHGGMAFSLERLDPSAARLSYEDSGLQNTYGYVEVSKMFAANTASDPDFEDTISFGLGFRLEF
jgi:hypothetical protein